MKRILAFFLFVCLLAPASSGKGKKADPNATHLRVGIVSDVHIREHIADSIFLQTLRWFKDQDIDAFVLAGDYTCDGLEEQMANVAKDWFSVFPRDKGLKGKHVERIIIDGNHEIQGHTYKSAKKNFTPEYIAKHNIRDRRAELWPKYWKEEFRPIYRKDVKGYTFIAAHYVSQKGVRNLSRFFEAQTDLPSGKPFFYISHNHQLGTMPSCTDDGSSTELFSNYPNLITFSGHCHTSLTYEKSIWQGAYTAVNTASLQRDLLPPGRINYDKNPESPMTPLKATDSHQGILMEVYADRVELHCMDFSHGAEICTWTIPNDPSKRPYSPELRAAAGAVNPPVFADGTRVAVKTGKGKNQSKKVIDQVRVYFSPALSTGEHRRAFDYMVVPEAFVEGTWTPCDTAYVYSPAICCAEQYEKDVKVKCCFDAAALPDSLPLRFEVRPRDSFGNCGEPVFSEEMILNGGIILGAERTSSYVPILRGRRIALLSNNTGIVPGGKHTLDILLENGLNVVKIFSPEHGFRGLADAGQSVENGVDEATGIPVVSLFGKDRNSPVDLSDVDIVVTDIQDVGLRYYTYYVTMLRLMNAAAGQDRAFMVMDRPNPNGMYVDGPILDMKYKSSVGALPIPVVHGLTLGEMAGMIDGEGWLEGGAHLRSLHIVKCVGYDHQKRYSVLVPPSPNLRCMKAIYLYPSTCYFEHTPVSLGRGTDKPFMIYGHPSMKGDFEFIPESGFGAKNPEQKGKLCHGVDLSGLPDEEIIARGINLEYVIDAYRQVGDSDGRPFFTKFFTRLIGRDDIAGMIEAGKSAADIEATWADDVEAFKKLRRKYLLYKE